MLLGYLMDRQIVINQLCQCVVAKHRQALGIQLNLGTTNVGQGLPRPDQAAQAFALPASSFRFLILD